VIFFDFPASRRTRLEWLPRHNRWRTEIPRSRQHAYEIFSIKHTVWVSISLVQRVVLQSEALNLRIKEFLFSFQQFCKCYTRWTIFCLFVMRFYIFLVFCSNFPPFCPIFYSVLPESGGATAPLIAPLASRLLRLWVNTKYQVPDGTTDRRSTERNICARSSYKDLSHVCMVIRYINDIGNLGDWTSKLTSLLTYLLFF